MLGLWIIFYGTVFLKELVKIMLLIIFEGIMSNNSYWFNTIFSTWPNCKNNSSVKMFFNTSKLIKSFAVFLNMFEIIEKTQN